MKNVIGFYKNFKSYDIFLYSINFITKIYYFYNLNA